MADFKRDLLFYAGINTYTGSMYNIGNITMLGNGSYFEQLEVEQITVTGNAVIPGIQFDSLTVAGNVVSGGNFIGNGALMTGVTSTLPTQANIDIVGNVTASGNVAAQYFIGNGSALTGLLSTLPVSAKIDITGNVTAPGNIVVAGQVNVAGNVQGTYFIGNGALLSGLLTQLPATANIDIIGNVTAPGDILVSGQVLAIGNVQAQYFKGNGAFLTGLSGVNAVLPATANIDITGNVIAPGNISVSGQVNVVGNVQGNYFIGNGALLSGLLTELPAVADIDIIGNVTAPGDIVAAGQVLAIGNVQANYFKGNGAFLTGLTGVNAIFPATANIDIRGNVVSPGNIAVAGQVNVIGNVTGRFFIGNGALLTGVTPVIPTVANIDIVGNVTAPGNVIVSGQIDAVGNVAAAYFKGNGAFITGLEGIAYNIPKIASVDIIGNVTAPGNVIATGQVNIGGNVAAGFFIGNGSLLTGITSNTVTSFTAGGVTIAPGNLTLTTDQYVNISASNTTALNIAINSVNTPGNLLALSDSGFISQNNLAGYLVVPLGYVANTQARLAIAGGNAPIGSLVTQTDTGNTYLLASTPSSLAVNWLGFNGGNFPVTSVFGRVGAVTAQKGDYADDYIILSKNVGSVPAGISVSDAVVSIQKTKANIIGGNITASYFIGNGALLTGLSNVAASIPSTANIDIIGNVTASGNITVAGQVNVVGNVWAQFYIGNGSFLTGLSSSYPQRGNIDFIGNVRSNGNITVGGQVTVGGNVQASYFVGNGRFLTQVGVTVFPPRTNVDIVGNVTAPGNIIVAGDVNVAGAVTTASFLRGNGAFVKVTNKFSQRGPLTGNLDALPNVYIFSQQTPFVWSSVPFGTPISNNGGPTYDNIALATAQGVSGFYESPQNGWRFMRVSDGPGAFSSLAWPTGFDFNQDFIMNYSFWTSDLYGSMWVSVGGSSPGGLFTPVNLSNGALSAYLNFDQYSSSMWYNTASINAVSGLHVTNGWLNYSFSVKTIAGKRYAMLKCETYGTFETCADVTSWVPSDSYMVIAGKTDITAVGMYLNNVSLEYL